MHVHCMCTRSCLAKRHCSLIDDAYLGRLLAPRGGAGGGGDEPAPPPPESMFVAAAVAQEACSAADELLLTRGSSFSALIELLWNRRTQEEQGAEPAARARRLPVYV